MHLTDDLQARGALMVARAAADAPRRPRLVNLYNADPSRGGYVSVAHLEAVRRLSASDAALARAIDAVPGRG